MKLHPAIFGIIACITAILASACVAEAPALVSTPALSSTPEPIESLDGAGALTATKAAIIDAAFATRDAASTIRAVLTATQAAIVASRTQSASGTQTARPNTPSATQIAPGTLTARAAYARASLTAHAQITHTATVTPQRALTARAVAVQKTLTALPDAGPCIRWDLVTADMVGTRRCVRGLLAKHESKGLGTRFEFSDEPNAFFMWSLYGFHFINQPDRPWPDPGSCVQYTGVVEVSDGIPWMNLELDPANPNSLGAFLQQGPHGLQVAPRKPWSPVLLLIANQGDCN